EDATRALALDPGNASALATRAAAHWGLKHVAEAIDDATKSLEREPRHPAALIIRSLAREQAGDLKGALEDTRESTKFVKSSAEAAACQKRIADLERRIAAR